MATIARRPVFREIATVKIDDRRVVVGIHPNGLISVRPKGTRQAYSIMATHAYEIGMRAEERAERARRKAARDKRRLERELALAFAREHVEHYPTLNGAKAPRLRKAPARPKRRKTKARRRS
jgi:hypothetical protein